MNLLTKLREKLKSFAYKVSHSKIVRGSLAFVMGLSIATAAGACSSSNNPSTDPDNPTPPVVDPSGKDPTNPTDPTNPSNPTQQYSQILQNVLKSSYYNNLINQYKKDSSLVYNYNYNTLNPVPYGFFEQQGLDIDGIKQNELKFYSNMYIKNDEPNNLYITTNVETKTSDSDYYNNYLLKYSLTDDELKDFKMLYGGNYTQANFFVQELSYVKTPTVISKFKIDVATYDGLLTALNKKSGVPEALSYKDINAFNINSIKNNPDNQLEHFINISFIASNKNSKHISSSIIGNFNIITRFITGLTYNNDILKINWPDRFRLDPNTNIQDSLTETITYQSYDEISKYTIE